MNDNPPTSLASNERLDMLIGGLQELRGKLTDSGLYENGISHASVYATIVGEAIEVLSAKQSPDETSEHHGLDNARQVFFYEQDFYVLSNFSAFMVQCNGLMFPTSEHAYHWDKFPDDPLKQRAIQVASSAHDAFKMAERWKQYRRPDWDDVKIGIMRGILRLKAEQHEYVRRKLLQTGDRELIENSWRDDFWGWGPNRDGANMLGKLWMEIRAELNGKHHSSEKASGVCCQRSLETGGQRHDANCGRGPL